MPSVLDREINSLDRDAFGHAHFAGALRSLLESEDNQPPFSVGMLGPWGTGKSTIKELYLAGLRDDQRKADGQSRRERCHAVTFNAWRYGGEGIKRALLRHVFIALGGEEEVLRRELYQQVQQSTTTTKGLLQWTKEAILQNAVSALLFAFLLLVVFVSAKWFATSLEIEDQLGLSVFGLSASAMVVFLAKFICDIRIKSPTLFNPTTTIQFPMTSAEEYELLLIQQLGRFKGSKKGRHCRRLIIFVDDLDRLSAAEMVSGLDAVRMFLELPRDQLPQELGVIFVISCDEDRVAEALARGRGRLGSGDLPGSVFTRSDARRYLDRLFQFRLEIPPFPKRDMRRFIDMKLQEMAQLKQAIEKRKIRSQDVIDHLIHTGVQSPRKAIQILNSFAQAWWIASERERDGTGSDQPGLLHAGAVTDHPLSLAAICVLRVDFPDFYSRLQARPTLIDEFSGVVFGTVSPLTLPLSARQVLSEFLVSGEDGSLQKEVKEAHRPLRQYLASLRGMRWPKRLQPLLLLAEDAVTRRYGPKAAELHDAFVSGDTKGVLEVFGRNLNDKPLGLDDVRLLEDLSEEIALDTETRRIGAARLLADLAHRLPGKHARGIMTSLARQMIGLRQVRMGIGPHKAVSILAHCSAPDQREVAARYCEDLLHDQPIEYQLPTGESPNLEELSKIVIAGCNLVLIVRNEHDLPSRADNLLLDWLASRQIHLKKDSTSLPFKQLDEWVAAYEPKLLRDLGERYSDLAIAEFEADNTAGLGEKPVLGRVQSVHNQLVENGEESRQVLWEQLTRLVAVRDQNAASVAWRISGQHADFGSAPHTSRFVAAMAGRLEKELSGEDEWALDWRAGGEQLIDLIAQWNAGLDIEAIERVSSLAKAWAGYDETSELASKAYTLLRSAHGEAADSVMDEWADSPFGGDDSVPWPIRKLIATEFQALGDAQTARVVEHLDEVIGDDDIPETTANEYHKFVQAIPRKAWELEPLRAHVDRLFSRIKSMYQNENEYLSRLFPAARSLMLRGTDGTSGSMLQYVFEHAAAVPPAYVLLHKHMARYWPDPSTSVGSYEPEKIFDRAVQFIGKHVSVEGIGDVFLSIADLCRRSLVPESKGTDLAQCAVRLWPNAAVAVQKATDVFAPQLTPESACELVIQSGSSWGEPDVDVPAFISDIAKSQDTAAKYGVTRNILQKVPQSIDEKPDGALSVWLNTLGEELEPIIANLLNAEDLNDSQKNRVVRQALARITLLSLSFFIETLPSLLGDQSLTSTGAAVLDSIEEINGVMKSLDKKNQLSKALIGILPQVSGDNRIAISRWIRSLGGQAALETSTKTLKALGIPGLEDVVKQFPGSKKLKKALERSRRQEEP